MKRNFTKYSGMMALALTLTMWGCDQVGERSGALMGPGGSSEALVIDKDKRGYTVATETDPTVGVVSAVIDKAGGSLVIGPHTLEVPRNAVREPTRFTMRKVPGTIRVDLTAGENNDVGREGFRRTLTLTLSYANAASLPNENGLKVVWVKPDGGVEAVPSSLDKRNREVTGHLNHFSDYGVGWPD